MNTCTLCLADTPNKQYCKTCQTKMFPKCNKCNTRPKATGYDYCSTNCRDTKNNNRFFIMGLKR